MNHRKIVIFCLLFAAALVYLVAAQSVDLIFDVLGLPVNRDLGLTIPEYAGVGVAGLVYILVVKSARAMTFFDEVVIEMFKVAYPTPKESVLMARQVLVMLGLATVFLALVDLLWSTVTRAILNIG
jgi:preprotein translocase SecE subunit